jgi:hypothetical protein
MISKPHRGNSDFQLRHFFVGSCHTADGAYAVMYAEKINLEGKLRHSEAQKLRRDAKIAAAKEIMAESTSSRSAWLNAKADIIEQEADLPTWEMNLAAARAELATIVELMAQIEPLRKFAHLPILEANEAAQTEEWKRELMYRAENFLLTQGSIPHDHFARMREHPAFKTEIFPYINQTHTLLKQNRVDEVLGQTETLSISWEPKN